MTMVCQIDTERRWVNLSKPLEYSPGLGLSDPLVEVWFEKRKGRERTRLSTSLALRRTHLTGTADGGGRLQRAEVMAGVSF
ncbi:hypothetical protein V6N12_005608 [Hibiscus sabdariffa]|uniref:Uncharacterized protein n=1 Tax=Hibiscus sabdariffa TaxID=183260 RepID=A0ABR2BAE5_9ROSI